MTHDIDGLVAAMETVAGAMENVTVPLLVIELAWLWDSKRLDRARLKEMAANVSSLVVVIPAGFVGLTLWYTIFETIRDIMPFAIPVNWATAAMCLLAVDLIYYTELRFEHTHRLPWDLYHSVHHSSTEFDQTTSLRLSGFDALLTMGFLTPAVVLGFHPLLVLGSYGLVIGYQTWIHTELIKRTPGWFVYVFDTPSHHLVHHGADPAYLDVNYGGILILWDRFFGTFQLERQRPTYGLTTQINSSHPFDVQFSESRRLWSELRQDHDWSTRLRRLWNPPGWQPERAENQRREPVNAQ
jgi:sterol desaturase/sphingolipid hydroxylase (fatty acid hydroxylase superfamily)